MAFKLEYLLGAELLKAAKAKLPKDNAKTRAIAEKTSAHGLDYTAISRLEAGKRKLKNPAQLAAVADAYCLSAVETAQLAFLYRIGNLLDYPVDHFEVVHAVLNRSEELPLDTDTDFQDTTLVKELEEHFEEQYKALIDYSAPFLQAFESQYHFARAYAKKKSYAQARMYYGKVESQYVPDTAHFLLETFYHNYGQSYFLEALMLQEEEYFPNLSGFQRDLLLGAPSSKSLDALLEQETLMKDLAISAYTLYQKSLAQNPLYLRGHLACALACYFLSQLTESPLQTILDSEFQAEDPYFALAMNHWNDFLDLAMQPADLRFQDADCRLRLVDAPLHMALMYARKRQFEMAYMLIRMNRLRMPELALNAYFLGLVYAAHLGQASPEEQVHFAQSSINAFQEAFVLQPSLREEAKKEVFAFNLLKYLSSNGAPIVTLDQI